MSTLSYSQPGYPKLIQSGTDTFVAITLNQMKALNEVKVELDYSRIVIEGLEGTITQLKSAVSTRDTMIIAMREIDTIQTTRVTNCNAMLDEVRVAINKAEKRIKWLKFQRTLFISGFIVEAGIIAFLAIR